MTWAKVKKWKLNELSHPTMLFISNKLQKNIAMWGQFLQKIICIDQWFEKSSKQSNVYIKKIKGEVIISFNFAYWYFNCILYLFLEWHYVLGSFLSQCNYQWLQTLKCPVLDSKLSSHLNHQTNMTYVRKISVKNKKMTTLFKNSLGRKCYYAILIQ